MTQAVSGTPQWNSTPDSNEPDRPHAADLELASAALAGEDVAQRLLAQRMRCVPRMVAARNAAMGDFLRQEDVADVAQETALRLWTELSTFAGDTSLEAWAFEVGRREFESEARRGVDSSDDALAAARQQLDSLGVGEREDFVRAATAGGPVSHEDDVIAALKEAMAQSAPKKPTRQPATARAAPRRDPLRMMLSPWSIGGAVVAVGLSVFAPVLFPAAEPGGEDRALSPAGLVERFGTFTWPARPCLDCTHRLRLWFGESPDGAAGVDIDVTGSQQWEPGPETLALLAGSPNGAYWQVVEIDAAGLAETVIGGVWTATPPADSAQQSE